MPSSPPTWRPIDYLAGLETFQQILRVLKPKELDVIDLRLHGYSDAEIARELGIHRSSVLRRVRQARRRVARALPEVVSNHGIDTGVDGD